MAPGTLVSFNQLTRLIALEDFVKASDRTGFLSLLFFTQILNEFGKREVPYVSHVSPET
jgi:hypothetical protein